MNGDGRETPCGEVMRLINPDETYVRSFEGVGVA